MTPLSSRQWLLRRILERNGPDAEMDIEIERHNLPLPIIGEHGISLSNDDSIDWSTVK